MTFSFSDLHPSLSRAVDDLGFDRPTPIQRDAIPPALEGRDLLACAMTGSGKTAAFLIPIIERLRTKKAGTTRALVMTPTRELAAQIVESFQDLARHTHLKAAAVYGGVGMGPQEKAFRRGVDVIVACPGRLLDHFQYPYAKLRGLEVLVLDEADRMLDMGFLPDIRRVLRHIPEANQTHLFSATMPAPIVELARKLLDNPKKINIERRSAPATGIEQSIFPVRQDLKSELLVTLLQSGEIFNVLVFTRTKHRADRLAKLLVKRGIKADRIHGNRSQSQRTRALAAFKNHDLQVLVATDIAARGIDVEALSHVINFDVPHMPEDYIHRVGRTARARATGEAFTFVSPEEMNDLRAIERAVGKRLPQRKIEGFDATAKATEKLEIPIAERIAAIRARKAEDRARSRAKAARRGESGGRQRRGGAASGRRRQGGASGVEGREENPRRNQQSRKGSPQKGRTQQSGAQKRGAQKSGATAGNNSQGNRSSRPQGRSSGSAGRSSTPNAGLREGTPRDGGRKSGGRPGQPRSKDARPGRKRSRPGRPGEGRKAEGQNRGRRTGPRRGRSNSASN